MWNPFKAIGGALAKAGRAVGNVIGGGLEKTGGAVSKAGTKMKSAPTRPPAAKEPTRPPAAKAPTEVMPAVKPTPPKAPDTGGGKKLPPSMVRGGRTSGMARDDAILGADSDAQRELLEAVKEFEAEHSMLGLSREARDFLEHASFAAVLDKYVPGGGFDSAQWENGMSNVRNIRITRTGDGIDIIFDADFSISGDSSGDLGERSPRASF